MFYASLWSVSFALRQSSMLIGVGSTLRASAVAAPSISTTEARTITKDSALCSGQQVLVNRLLIGRPSFSLNN